MLSPDELVLLVDLLAPPAAGFRLERAVGTTFTLHLTALLPVPLGLAGADLSRTTDPLGVLQAVRNYSDRIDAPATLAQKKQLAALTPDRLQATELAGDGITSVLSHARGNGGAIGGIKVISEGGWFAARPSGTENIYKIYGESFRSADHLQRILGEAQAIVDAAIAPS